MKKINKIFIWVSNRFENVWNSKYPKYWHIINLFCGLISALIFVIGNYNYYSVKVLIGLFFVIWLLTYLFIFSFTYGIIRARKAWTKKRK